MGSANISLTLILALGSPRVWHHMAYIGTPAPLILPRTMAQDKLHSDHTSYLTYEKYSWWHDSENLVPSFSTL